MATTSPSFLQSPADVSAQPVPVARAKSVIDLIGNTPLLEISRITAGLLRPGVRIFAKLETFNPGGSVKDRAVRKMVEVGLANGDLRPGRVIIDSTSGNTGIGAIVLCRKIIRENPQSYFKPDQYNNEANPLAHFETTGPEIWRQTAGEVTHFVAGVGTSGTVMGTGRYLKMRNPAIQVIAAEPDDPMHGLEGLKHMASSIVPGIYHEDRLDRKVPVSTEDAYDMVYALGQVEGVLVGQSSGAAMIAALRVARELREGCVVTVFPDSGDKYLSTNLWIGWTAWDRSKLKGLLER
jgi:cysteine synthase B